MLHFDDDISINTSGQLRTLKLKDGLYVVGSGCCIPVKDEAEAQEIISNITDSD